MVYWWLNITQWWRYIWKTLLGPTELELKKENNSNSFASFFDIYIHFENWEFHTKLFDKRDNFGFDNIRMLFYYSNVPSKIFYGSIGAEFHRTAAAISKIEGHC